MQKLSARMLSKDAILNSPEDTKSLLVMADGPEADVAPVAAASDIGVCFGKFAKLVKLLIKEVLSE